MITTKVQETIIITDKITKERQWLPQQASFPRGPPPFPRIHSTSQTLKNQSNKVILSF